MTTAYLNTLTIALSFMTANVTEAWTGGSSSARNKHALSSSSSFTKNRNKPHPSSLTAGSRRSIMAMYFDDASRSGTDPWDPSSSENGPTPSWEMMRQQQQQQQEEDMIQRILTGYDAQAASQLSQEEIQKQTQLWTQKSGVVGDFFGDELFTDLLSVNVVRSSSNDVVDDSATINNDQAPLATMTTTSLVHCMANFWQAVANVIDLHTDKDVWPNRWTPHARYENLNTTARLAGASPPCEARGDRVHLIVLPDCPNLYEYATFTTVLAAVEFSKELCLHLGRHFTLTAFHPHFKNSPTLMSPERHAPFPTIGLQFPRRGNVLVGQDADLPHHGRQWKQPLEQSKTNDNGKILPHPEGPPEDEEIGALADARIRNLDETRNSLEVLFNSAAATENKADNAAAGGSSSFPAPASSEQATTARSSTATYSFDYYSSLSTTADEQTQQPQDANESSVVSEEEQLARTFRQERQRRRGDWPPEMVRQVVALWMDEQRYADASRRQLNPALEFMDTLEGYGTVCTQKVGELVYAEVWQAILEVYERGIAADTQLPPPPPTVPEKTEAKKNKHHFDISHWMHSLSNEKDTFADKNKKNDELPQVTSSLFIATKFNKYNAQAFKRFAITINAALKRITDGKMFLEVFHPEYVGNKGYNHALRRSPFPMIQICYIQQDTPSP